jgi:hypothetical protein
MNTVSLRAADVEATLAALERICFGELDEDQIERIHAVAVAHLDFTQTAQRLYSRAVGECENKRLNINYDESSYDMTHVAVRSAEHLPKSSTPRYEFNAIYQTFSDGSGGHWICNRQEAWGEMA